MHYHHFGDGRYVMRLDPGEDVIGSLRHFANDCDVAAGMITGIGSTSHVTLGFLDPETGEYVKRMYDEPMVVGNLTGTISVEAEDGKPSIHLHGVFGPRELLAYAGHVHEARVGAVIEIVIFAFSGRVERHKMPDKAFPWPLLPGEPRPGDEADPA
jgi:predicted DNA-binding protein with PD1-like motif